MEVEVVGVDGVPEDAIISIRAGASRRQAPVSALGPKGQPFKFSSGPAGCNPFKLDVLQPVGSARMALKPTGGTYTIPIKSNSIPGVTVQLNVKAGNSADNKKDVASDLFDRIDANRDGIISRREFTDIVKRDDDEKIVLQPLDEGDDVGVTPVGSSKLPPLPKDEDGRFPAAAAVAKEYLDKHKLLPFVRALLQSVVRERPDDPYCFIADQFRSLSDAGPSPPPARPKRAGDEDSVEVAKELPPPRPARALDFQGGEDPMDVAKELPPAPPSFSKNDGEDPPSIEAAKQLPAETTVDTSAPPTIPKDNEEGPSDVNNAFSMMPSTGTWLMKSPRSPQQSRLQQSPPEVVLSPANEPMVPALGSQAPVLGSQPFNMLPSAAPFACSPRPAAQSSEDQAKAKAREAIEAALLGSALTEEESKAKAREAIEAALLGSPSSEETTKAKARDALESALLGSDLAEEDAKSKARDALANALLQEETPKSAAPHPAVNSALHSLAADMGHDFSKLSPEQMDLANARAQEALSSLVKEAVSGPLSTNELMAAKGKARDALVRAMRPEEEEDMESAKAKARSALSSVFLEESDEEVEIAKSKARSALAAALMEDTQEDMEHAKSQARSALVAVLQKEGDMQDAKEKARVALAAALMGDHEEIEIAKTKARDALAAALMDDPDDVDIAKQKARDALTAALMDEEEEMEDAKENARLALFSILGGSQEEEVADAKEKARLALATALMGDEEEMESAKEKARSALAAALMDDEDHVEHAKEKARAALCATLMDDEDDLANAKQKARDALSAAFMDEDEEVEIAKQKARDALSSALMDAEDEVESAKAKARAALAQVMDVDDVGETNLVEEAKEKARTALQAALIEDAQESPTHEANMERAKARARASLGRSLTGEKDAPPVAETPAAKEAPPPLPEVAPRQELPLETDSAKQAPPRLPERTEDTPPVAETLAAKEAPPPLPEADLNKKVGASLAQASLDGSLVDKMQDSNLAEKAKGRARDELQEALCGERTDEAKVQSALDHLYRSDTKLVDSMSSAILNEEGVDRTGMASSVGGAGDSSAQKRKLLENKEHLTRMNHALRGEVEEMNDNLRILFKELRELKEHVKK